MALLREAVSLFQVVQTTMFYLWILRDTGVTGKELEARLDDCYITVNKNTIPNEPLSPFVTSGVRIGTAAVTTRGLKGRRL